MRIKIKIKPSFTKGESVRVNNSKAKISKIDKNGKIDSRMIEEFGIKKDDLSSTVMVFKSPASVKNTRFLKQENDGRADDKFIYLPALKRVSESLSR